jgi:hypothetical protein
LQTLGNPTPVASDLFGDSVVLSGNLAVVRAVKNDASATEAGSAYIFDVTAGALLQTLNNPNPSYQGWFGRSVAVTGSTVLVGALFYDFIGGINAA